MMRKPTAPFHIACLLFPVGALPTLAGCADDTENAFEAQSFDVRAWGEPFIEEGMGSDVFADGWSVTFDHYVVAISEPRLTEQAAFTEPGGYIVELSAPSNGEGHALTTLESTPDSDSPPILVWDHRPATGALGGAVAPGTWVNLNADAAIAQTMLADGLTMWVSGTASRGETTRRFEFGFDAGPAYRCALDTNLATITIHADHLFYNSLLSEEPDVVFDLIASAADDAQTVITLDLLDTIDITARADYQTGSFPVTTLGEFLRQQAFSVGHINGEGHCDVL